MPRMTAKGALLALLLVLGLAGSSLGAPDEITAVNGLLRDLQSPDFETSYRAAERLGRHPASRAQIVPALLAALKTSAWPRCGGDMRDAIARSLGDLGAREAVVPLLELVKSGRPIDHECVE